MGAFLDLPSVLHHDDLVAVADGGEAVGDGDHAAVHPRQHPVQRVLYQLLVLGVQRRRRFVEQQNRGVAQDGARDGDPLLLPAGELVPALADDHVQALRHLVDELPRVGLLARVQDLLLARLRRTRPGERAPRRRSDRSRPWMGPAGARTVPGAP